MTMISSDWQSQTLKKEKFGCPNSGPTGLNQGQNEVFRPFLEFGSKVFLEIAYNESLKLPKKIYGLNNVLTGSNCGRNEVYQQFLPCFINRGKILQDTFSNLMSSGVQSNLLVYFNFIWPFSAWCPLEGHTYLNKPAAFRHQALKA